MENAGNFKMNKHGWIRIVEAVIAILIIFAVVLVIISRQSSVSDVGNDVYEKQSHILDAVGVNEELRNLILEGDESEKIVPEVDLFIGSLVPASWDFSTKVCKLDRICSNPVDVINKEVYVSERMIVSNLTEYSPKKLKFFVWGK